MSRNVAQIARRPILQASTPIISNTAPTNRLLHSAISTPSQTVLLTRLPARAFTTYRHAATKDTKPVWLRSAAKAVNLQPGLRRVLHVKARPPSYVESVFATRTSPWREQRRLLSDGKVAEGRPSKRAQAASSEHTSAEEASRTAHHATSSGASKTILDRLPHLHRPTKEELLAAATGFWSRLRIRFKWMTIRSVRPFNMEEIGAFVSWIFLGHVIWIVIGTTTFVSLAIWAVNTVFAQETLAGWVGNYLTKSSGIKIVFENAIVPTWRDGVITFNNVFVSRRPGQQANKRSVSKGSSTTAAAAAEIAMAERTKESSDPEDDGNYSQFDVTIDSVNVTLSFSKWFNGKGLLRDVEIIGVRGVIDRTHVKRVEGYVDPKSYRHEHKTGDFEIDSFKMSDVLLTIHQPRNFRPFTISVFNCDLPRLRKQWLFYDFMSANNMSGSFDDSLFTVHPRQVHGTTGAQLSADGKGLDEHAEWKKHSRLRIDGLNIDHLNRGVQGPFSWIHEGNVDIVADVMIPNDADGIWAQSWRKSSEAVSNFYDRMEATVSSAQTTNQPVAAGTVLQHASDALDGDPAREQTEADKRILVLDIAVHLNDVRASVPLFTRDLSYVSNALVRPIVAYINSRRAFIPVTCRVVKRQSEFDGSWTVFDSGLLDDLSRETYEAFARDIEDVHARNRRIKKVGMWTLRLAAQALFLGLAGQLA